MKVVILAGGYGTRISEESYLKPKPMIEIGTFPILWHIMKIYSHYGFNDFIICAGYKQEKIKEWFYHYLTNTSDITYDFSHDNEIIVHNKNACPWKVTVVDTGLNTMTGGRVKRIQSYLDTEPFMLTYGDGVADININNLLSFHNSQGKLATLTAVQPIGRFGILDIEDNLVYSFREKRKDDMNWINAGFMVLSPKMIDYIKDDQTILERYPLETLANTGQLACYKHEGFWQCMDTMNDKNTLEQLWNSGSAPWKVWN